MKFLTHDGLLYFWKKVKTYIDTGLGSKADVSQIPTSLPANGGNASTVNGYTVNSNVPSGAKFTDTVYTHPSTHPYSMITGVPTSLPANGGNSDTVDGYHVTHGVGAGTYGLRVIQVSNVDIGVGASLSSGELYIVYE